MPHAPVGAKKGIKYREGKEINCEDYTELCTDRA
jgi:hypothetical protein